MSVLITSVSAAAGDDPFATFPLQERGIVVGAGAGIHALGLNSPKLVGVATSGFAYIGWLPLTGFLEPETRKYCSSYQDSQEQADVAAARRAFPDDPNPKLRIASDQQEIFARTGWRVNVRGSCWLMKFGFFAALPGDFDVDVKPSSGGAALSKNVRPLGTAGLLFAPLPYLHVLIGATLSNVAIEPTDAENDQQLWSMFFALGTTIDAVGAAIK